MVNKIIYRTKYPSPLGKIMLACDDNAITGLWFSGQKHFENIMPSAAREENHQLLDKARHWLDIYFSGNDPKFLLPLKYNTTEFRKMVWDILLTIPYGKTITYGEIAKKIAGQTGIERMSSQAVGSAVGHNPISIIIPCHRVVGTNGSLTGYAGGIDRKLKLLELERADMSKLFVPKRLVPLDTYKLVARKHKVN